MPGLGFETLQSWACFPNHQTTASPVRKELNIYGMVLHQRIKLYYIFKDGVVGCSMMQRLLMLQWWLPSNSSNFYGKTLKIVLDVSKWHHSSINYSYLVSVCVWKETEAHPSCLQVRQGTPWAGRQSLTGLTQRCTTLHTHIHTYRQIRVASWRNRHVFGLLEETGAPRGNLWSHRKNMQMLHR